ncbi:MAG: SGNH/GDSL hydrolase family protein [Thermoguttaceae bacterium]
MKMRRLLILLGIAILLSAVTAGYYYLVYARPEGSGPAGPGVPPAAFARTWTTRKVLLLGLGDSVTAGFGVAPPYSYFNRLVKNPPDEFDDMRGISLSAVLPNLRTENVALSGSTSIMHLETIRERVEKQRDDVFGLIVMTTGGNDLIHNYGRTPPHEGAMYGATLNQARPWIEKFAKRLDKMIGLLESRFPGGCLIFIADIYDPSDGVGDPASAMLPDWPDCLAIHRAYNEAIGHAAERHPSVRVVPMHAAFLGHGTHCTQPWREHYRDGDAHYWYGGNLEDPNARGYDAIRRLFLIEIGKEADRLAKSQPATPNRATPKPLTP